MKRNRLYHVNFGFVNWVSIFGFYLVLLSALFLMFSVGFGCHTSPDTEYFKDPFLYCSLFLCLFLSGITYSHSKEVLKLSGFMEGSYALLKGIFWDRKWKAHFLTLETKYPNRITTVEVTQTFIDLVGGESTKSVKIRFCSPGDMLKKDLDFGIIPVDLDEVCGEKKEER